MTKPVSALAPGDKIAVGRHTYEVASVTRFQGYLGAEGWLQIHWVHGTHSAPMSPLTELEIAP